MFIGSSFIKFLTKKKRKTIFRSIYKKIAYKKLEIELYFIVNFTQVCLNRQIFVIFSALPFLKRCAYRVV